MIVNTQEFIKAHALIRCVFNCIYLAQYCLTPACITVASAIINAIDRQVDPCQDFYQYSCGGWIKDNPLPDGKSIWGTFGKLWQENQLVMKNVLGKSFNIKKFIL